MKLATLRQRLFDVAAALSLAMCLLTGAIWARSLGHFEMLSWRYARWPQAKEVHAYSGFLAWYSNTIRVEVTHLPFRPAYFEGMTEDNRQTFRKLHPPGAEWAFVGENITAFMNGYSAGFSYQHTPYQTGDYYVLAVPAWLPALLASVLPILWLAHHRHRRGQLWQFGLRDCFLAFTTLATLLASGLWLMR